VFLVNSRSPHFIATPFSSTGEPLHLLRAHLLPKLRCYFAEFLNQSSLKRLGIFYLSTCVGLRYGHQSECLRGFSWEHGISHLSPYGLRHHASTLSEDPDLPKSSVYTLKPEQPMSGWPILLRPPLDNLQTSGTGILTRFPSTTLLSLALGTD
jgi:hypothetical protein